MVTARIVIVSVLRVCCLTAVVWQFGVLVVSLVHWHSDSLLVMSLVNCHVVQRVFAKSFLTGLCLLCVGCVLPDCLDVG